MLFRPISVYCTLNLGQLLHRDKLIIINDWTLTALGFRF